eukprot:93581_1
MALTLAQEFMACSICEDPLSESSLYMCTNDDCPKYGEIYCNGCGIIAHKRQDHIFDINGNNVKQMGDKKIKNSMKIGINKMNGALGSHKEQKVVGRRQNVVGTYLSLTTALDTKTILAGLDAFADVASEFASGSLALGTVTDAMQEILKNTAEGAGYAAVAMAAVESVYHTIRFCRGEIETGEEYAYHLAKGFSAAAGMGLGNWIGGSIGQAIGTIGGPIGIVLGGLIGGALGGLFGSMCGRAAFNKVWKEDFTVKQKQTARATLIREALLLFGYVSVNDIENVDIFNERELKKRYRRLAKQYHPDKNDGSVQSHTNFHTVNASLGCLLSLLKKKSTEDAIKQVKEIQRAIVWQ